MDKKKEIASAIRFNPWTKRKDGVSHHIRAIIVLGEFVSINVISFAELGCASVCGQKKEIAKAIRFNRVQTRDGVSHHIRAIIVLGIFVSINVIRGQKKRRWRQPSHSCNNRPGDIRVYSD